MICIIYILCVYSMIYLIEKLFTKIDIGKVHKAPITHYSIVFQYSLIT